MCSRNSKVPKTKFGFVHKLSLGKDSEKFMANDLNNEDRKLYLEAMKGLKENNLFSGKKSDFDKFLKLMGKAFKDARVVELLTITTE